MNEKLEDYFAQHAQQQTQMQQQIAKRVAKRKEKLLISLGLYDQENFIVFPHDAGGVCHDGLCIPVRLVPV